jgi:hypothetical protein
MSRGCATQVTATFVRKRQLIARISPDSEREKIPAAGNISPFVAALETAKPLARKR